MLDFSDVGSGIGAACANGRVGASRYRLEAVPHVLLDSSGTSRAQWLLVALLIRSWGEGSGVAENAPLHPSIFLVGDRKQSIYGFRDADVSVMEDAAGFVDNLRSEADSRRAISKSFRAVPQLLAFANDLFADIEKDPSRRDAFRFDEQDRFPLDDSALASKDPMVSASFPRRPCDCADIVSGEIRRLITEHGVAPRDVGILFARKTVTRNSEALSRARSRNTSIKDLGSSMRTRLRTWWRCCGTSPRPIRTFGCSISALAIRCLRIPALQLLAPNWLPRWAVRACPTPPCSATKTAGSLEHARGASRDGWISWTDAAGRILERALNETAYLLRPEETEEAGARKFEKNTEHDPARAEPGIYDDVQLANISSA